MEFNELMAAFGDEIGIADLRPDEDGICNLAFDGMNVSFTSVPETERLAVWAEIGEMPPEGGDRTVFGSQLAPLLQRVDELLDHGPELVEIESPQRFDALEVDPPRFAID